MLGLWWICVYVCVYIYRKREEVAWVCNIHNYLIVLSNHNLYLCIYIYICNIIQAWFLVEMTLRGPTFRRPWPSRPGLTTSSEKFDHSDRRPEARGWWPGCLPHLAKESGKHQWDENKLTSGFKIHLKPNLVGFRERSLKNIKHGWMVNTGWFKGNASEAVSATCESCDKPFNDPETNPTVNLDPVLHGYSCYQHSYHLNAPRPSPLDRRKNLQWVDFTGCFNIPNTRMPYIVS